MAAPLAQVAAAVALFILVYPLLQLVRGALTLVVGALLRAAGGWELARAALLSLPADPVYSRMALHSVTGAEPLGLAAGGAIGAALRGFAPTFFLEAAPGDGLFTAMFGPSSPLAALALCRFTVETSLLGAGLALALGAPTSIVHPWRVCGMLLYLDAAIRAVRVPPSALDLDAAGASFLVYALAPQATRRDIALSDLLGAYPDVVVGLALGLAVLASAHLVVGLVSALVLVGRRAVYRRDSAQGTRRTPGAGRLALMPLLVSATVALGLQVLMGDQPSRAATSLAGVEALLANREPTLTEAASARRPAVVRVSGGERVYSYTVNGRPEVIRGMGYNPILSDQPAANRRAIYERDFAMMRRANVNLVGGWFEREFDEVLLDAAGRNGLGVLMPYHLLPEADYENVEYRERLATEVLSWVVRYRRHPSVHMWGLSNEVLHKLIYPSWLGRPNEEAWIRRADAFSDFLIDLADRAHRIDPGHPIVIREAEEAYVGPIVHALAQRPGDRPWLIWGVNSYTQRLGAILDWWKDQGPDHPVLITEFAEGGLPPGQRAGGYERMWAALRRYPSFVLGGMAYVWSSKGPEEVDRVFGLVEPDGRPVGNTLAAVSRIYAEDLDRR